MATFTPRRSPFIVGLLFLLGLGCSSSSLQKAPAMPSATPKPTFYYVFDALCGWCYGFSPTIVRIEEAYKDKLEFEVVSGGMVTGSRIGPIGQMAPFIKKAYKEVEKATGTLFGKAFIEGTLEKGTAQFSSIEPALALATVRSHNPSKAVAFAHDLQHAIYFDGVPPTDLEALAPYAEKYGLSQSQFLKDAKSEAMKLQSIKEFRTSDSIKVTGFPTMFIFKDNKLIKLAEGYLPQAELEKRIDKVLGL